MKRIWLKPDGRKWIKEGIKTTTFRKNKKQGLHQVVEGNWYDPKPIDMIVQLTPIAYLSKHTVIQECYSTEGDFNTPEEFLEWLKKNKLNLPDDGWLHRIELKKGEQHETNR